MILRGKKYMKHIIFAGIFLLLILCFLFSKPTYYGQPSMELKSGNHTIQIQNIKAFSNSMSFTILTDMDYEEATANGRWELRCGLGGVSSLLYGGGYGQSLSFFEKSGKLAAQVDINSIGLRNRTIKMIMDAEEDDGMEPIEIAWRNLYFPKREIRYFAEENEEKPVKVVCSNGKEIYFKLNGNRAFGGDDDKIIYHDGTVLDRMDGSYGHGSNNWKYYNIVFREEVDLDEIREIHVGNAVLKEVKE